VLCNDPASYAGGSVPNGRATLAGQVEGEHPDRDTLAHPVGGWTLGVLLATALCRKNSLLRRFRTDRDPPGVVGSVGGGG